MDALTKLKRLSSPSKIQDYLDALPFNKERTKETCSSPAVVLERGTAHCMEGALLAAAALSLQGEDPVLLHLKTGPGDQHHALALFKRNGYWGAISKTTHPVLRWRDPIYTTPRELALSYFHEYFLNDGRKTLLGYSKPFSLKRYGKNWITSKDDLWNIAHALTGSKHTSIVPKKNRKYVRKASPLERKAALLTK